MMDWTDRHCRYFHRQLSRRALLYTEMVTAAALVRGGARRLLAFDPAEHPVAVQLGGSDPRELAAAARMAAAEGYDEINLNVGCPSDRVQSGCFGAVLMRRPDLVAACVAAMRDAVDVEITVKCRIGVDDQDPAAVLPAFLARLQTAGVRRVAIHARKAWLAGLSPRENRMVPPLDYAIVLAMKREFPDLQVMLNGGVETLDQAEALLAQGFDGVMIGRAAYHTPAAILGGADRRIFGVPDAPLALSPEGCHAVVAAMRAHIERHCRAGGRVHDVARHMLGLFAGQPGARLWRRHLSSHAVASHAGPEVLDAAYRAVRAAQAQAPEQAVS